MRYLNSPSLGGRTNDLLDLVRDGIAILNAVLQDARSEDVTQGSLGSTKINPLWVQ